MCNLNDGLFLLLDMMYGKSKYCSPSKMRLSMYIYHFGGAHIFVVEGEIE